jgi:hypothetical protein
MRDGKHEEERECRRAAGSEHRRAIMDQALALL